MLTLICINIRLQFEFILFLSCTIPAYWGNTYEVGLDVTMKFLPHKEQYGYSVHVQASATCAMK